MGKVLKGIGKLVGKAAPLAGLIPGIGPLAAMGIGAGAKFLSKGRKTKIGDVLGGAAGGLGGHLAAGKLGGLGGIGKVVSKTFTTPEGGLDLGRILGAGSAISQVVGQRATRKSAQSRLGAEDAVRNQILSRLLAKPEYNFTPGGP